MSGPWVTPFDEMVPIRCPTACLTALLTSKACYITKLPGWVMVPYAWLMVTTLSSRSWPSTSSNSWPNSGNSSRNMTLRGLALCRWAAASVHPPPVLGVVGVGAGVVKAGISAPLRSLCPLHIERQYYQTVARAGRGMCLAQARIAALRRGRIAAPDAL